MPPSSTYWYNIAALRASFARIPELPAAHVTVVLDACFSGRYSEGSLLKDVSPITIEVRGPTSVLSNGSVFMSSGPSEVSHWYPESKHGLFTYYFLKGCQGEADRNKDGRVTAVEMDGYLSEEVPYMARRLHGGSQNPQVHAESDVIIVQ